MDGTGGPGRVDEPVMELLLYVLSQPEDQILWAVEDDGLGDVGCSTASPCQSGCFVHHMRGCDSQTISPTALAISASSITNAVSHCVVEPCSSCGHRRGARGGSSPERRRLSRSEGEGPTSARRLYSDGST